MSYRNPHLLVSMTQTTKLARTIKSITSLLTMTWRILHGCAKTWNFSLGVQLDTSWVSAVNMWDIKSTTRREIPYLQVTMYYFVYYINIIDTLVNDDVFDDFPKNSEDFPKLFWSYINFDHTPTNLSVPAVKGTNEKSYQNWISPHVISYRFYHDQFSTTRYFTGVYIIKNNVRTQELVCCMWNKLNFVV